MGIIDTEGRVVAMPTWGLGLRHDTLDSSFVQLGSIHLCSHSIACG